MPRDGNLNEYLFSDMPGEDLSHYPFASCEWIQFFVHSAKIMEEIMNSQPHPMIYCCFSIYFLGLSYENAFVSWKRCKFVCGWSLKKYFSEIFLAVERKKHARTGKNYSDFLRKNSGMSNAFHCFFHSKPYI